MARLSTYQCPRCGTRINNPCDYHRANSSRARAMTYSWRSSSSPVPLPRIRMEIAVLIPPCLVFNQAEPKLTSRQMTENPWPGIAIFKHKSAECLGVSWQSPSILIQFDKLRKRILDDSKRNKGAGRKNIKRRKKKREKDGCMCERLMKFYFMIARENEYY